MKQRAAFRVAVRAIGVLLFAESTAYAAPGIIDWVLTARAGGGVDWNAATYWLSYIVVALSLSWYLVRGAPWIVDLAVPRQGGVCEDCGYPLRGLGGTGRCPECGTTFTNPSAD